MRLALALLLCLACCGCDPPTPAPKVPYKITLTRPTGEVHQWWEFYYTDMPRIYIRHNISYVNTPELNRIVAPVGWFLVVEEKRR